jgi:hypothetical protein
MKFYLASFLLTILFVSSLSNPVPETKSDEVKVEPEIKVEPKSEDVDVKQKPVKEPSVTDLLQQIFSDDDDKEDNTSSEKQNSNSTSPPNLFQQFQQVIKPIETFLQTNPVSQFFSGQSTNSASNDEQQQPDIMTQFTTQFSQLQQQLSQFASNFVNAIIPTTTPKTRVDPEVAQEASNENESSENASNEVRDEYVENREIPDKEKKVDEEQKNEVAAPAVV